MGANRKPLLGSPPILFHILAQAECGTGSVKHNFCVPQKLSTLSSKPANQAFADNAPGPSGNAVLVSCVL